MLNRLVSSIWACTIILLLVPFSFTVGAQVLGEPTSLADPNTDFESAEFCSGCHMDQYEQWRSSMMSYSSISPPIHALELSENHVERIPTTDPDVVELFGFGRLSRLETAPEDSTQPYQEPRLFCQKCHAPVAVFTDLFSLYENFDFFESLDANGNLQKDAAGDYIHERDSFPDSHSLLRQIIVNDPSFDTSLYRDGTFQPTERQVDNAKTAVEGVTCTICHRMTGQETFANLQPNDDENFFGARPFLPDEEGVANSAYHIARGTGVFQTNYGPYDSSGNPFFDSGNLTGPHSLTAPHGVGLSTVANEVEGKVAGAQLITGTDGVDRPYLSSSLMCGSCHDVRIPFTDAESGEDFRRVENLFTEWRNSPWNNNDQPYIDGAPTPSPLSNPGEPVEEGLKAVTTCQDCHMSKYMTELDALPKSYDEGTISTVSSTVRRKTNHRFVGVDRFLIHDIPKLDEMQNPNADDLGGFDIAEIENSPTGLENFSELSVENLDFSEGKADLRKVLLQKAVAFNVESAKVNEVSNELNIAISVENIGAGHNIPSGLSQERQVWIELEVLDRDGNNVYTSGYLSPVEQERFNEINDETGNLFVLFNPDGEGRYIDSDCGRDDGKLEYLCDLDEFRAELDPALRVIGDIEVGFDDNLRENNEGEGARTPVNLGLINYQNGFRRNGEKVLTQFIGDSIDNGNSIKPFERRLELYDVPLENHEGPFKVSARLRFRPLPHEFLAALEKSSTQSRVSKNAIKLNKIIEMEQDACIVNANDNDLRISNVRSCNPIEPLAAGLFSRCAIFGDHQEPLAGTQASPGNSVQCNGRNADREIPVGLTTSEVLDPTIAPELNNVQSIAMGGSFGCALHFDGTVSCWGDGEYGVLGDDDITAHTVISPKAIAGLTNVRQIAAGNIFACAITNLDEVSCWGNGNSGNLGDGDLSSHSNGVPHGFSALGVESIAVGTTHACYIGEDSVTGESGRVYCWGGDDGNGFDTDIALPTEVRLNRQAIKVVAGADHSCALLKTGEVVCWGRNGLGQLGQGDTSTSVSLDPLTVDLGRRALDISSSAFHSCALLSDRTLKCWGLGNIGNSTASGINPAPLTVETSANVSLQNVRYVDAGNHTTCAITNSDTTYCWGLNGSGQLGLGDEIDRPFATEVTYQTAGKKVPYYQDFERGLPGADEGWYYYSSNSIVGRIEVVNGKLRMDVDTNAHGNLNEAILRVDMSNTQSAQLSFFQSDHSDEPHPMPASFQGHHFSDGVAVSNDGFTWYRILPSVDLEVNDSGQYYSVDLDQAVVDIRAQFDSSFTAGSDFQIKFQQFDNYTFPTDGREWDNISVTALPIAQNFENGLPDEIEGWEFRSSNLNVGEIYVEDGELRMAVNDSGTYNLNEAILTVDLSNRSGILLEFFQADIFDEQDTMPVQFTGSSDSDGVAISADDGITWYRISGEDDLEVSQTGSFFSIDLDSEISIIQQNFDSGFNYGANFKIKFQQYDNYVFGTDGRAWDDISLSH